MNKRILILAVFVLSLIVNAPAQLLWKVSGNGLTKPSYLFGTHHLIEKEQIRDFDKILALAGQADAVVGEMEMKNMLGMQLKMLKGVMMRDSTERELMSEADYNMVDAEFKQTMNMGLTKLNKMKPMMLSALYSIKIYSKLNNLRKQPEGVDMLFQNIAHKNKKSVIGLETIEQQIDIMFNSIPLKRQADLLVSEVKEKEKGVENLKKMNAAYLAGDLAQLEALNNDDEMTADERKIMIGARNDAWMKKLVALIPDKSCFVAVGCMHLTGEAGLISQLRKAGYTLEGIGAL